MNGLLQTSSDTAVRIGPVISMNAFLASSASSMALRPMRSVFPSIFQKHSARRGRTLPPSRATSDSTSGGSRNTESASCGEEAPTRECSGEESPGGRLMREVLDRTKHMGKPIIVPNQVEQAKRRGRFAEETMAQEAVERASNKPP
uniref:Uncharacterized protein n=1 Tax=Parascaris equorum TaxID=6256 RepID=A0A914S185_PAREQ